MSGIEVVGLSYYPIKSCAGVDAQQVAFSEFGIEHDREWMIIDAKGKFLSQRKNPELALVQPRVEDDALAVDTPGVGQLVVPLDTDGETIPVEVWKRPGTGTDQGTEANQYFSD